MMSVLEKIKELGISLPPKLKATSGQNYPFNWVTECDNRLIVSGHLPQLSSGELSQIRGKLGKEITPKEGTAQALLCIYSILGSLSDHLDGDLNRIKRWAKLTVFLNSTSEFEDHAEIIKPVSEQIINIFGEKGKHSRSVYGVASLPYQVAVKIEAELIVE